MESISRISSMLDTARELTVEAALSAGTIRSLASRSAIRELPFAQIKKLLDSRHDREILEGLRKVISMMYRSKPCLPYFSSVVKNVASPNIEIKKLVYIYLLRYAESEPDLALLSINTIQKSLSDQNPLVRAMALRVMSGIRVPVISQIVSLAIKKGCGDMSPLVRKAAALAIPKCYKLDPGTLPHLLDYLSTLLGDRQYYVVGSAVTAFLEVCPESIDLIHKHYRALVRKLVDMDDWGQLALLKLMLFYARKCFPQPPSRKKEETAPGFSKKPESTRSDEQARQVQIQDPDHELLLKACKSLLTSRNSAVVVAVARCYLYLGTREYIDSAIGPMIALLRTSTAFHPVVLYNLVALCMIRPMSFVSYIRHFFVQTSDTPEVWQLKIEILTLTFHHCTEPMKGVILNELEHFTKADDKSLVRESVRAIGRCAHNDNGISARCLNLLLKQASSPDGALVAESLNVVRHLIQQDPTAHTKTVIRLAKNLDSMADPSARSSIIWLVGEFAAIGGEDNIAPDVLRILVRGFANESEATRLQIVLLGAKVYVLHLTRTNKGKQSAKGDTPTGNDLQNEEAREEASTQTEPEHPISIIWHHLLLLARYDVSYDLRDRARLFKALLSDPTSTQLATLLLLAPKPVPSIPSPSHTRKNFLLGSSSLVLGEDAGPLGLTGYEPLPDWVEPGKEPDRKLRDEVGTKPEYSGALSVPAGDRLDSALKQKERERPSSWTGSNKDKTLDDWLAEDDHGAESEGSTETESEEEDDEEEEEGEEEEEEEEEDDEDEASDDNEANRPLTS